jgi:hypothetical protein
VAVAVAALCCEPEPVVLLAERRHRQDVGLPEGVALAPVDGLDDLVDGAAVEVDEPSGFVPPLLGDVGPFGAVVLDAVGEVPADLLDVGAGWDGYRRRGFSLIWFLSEEDLSLCSAPALGWSICRTR